MFGLSHSNTLFNGSFLVALKPIIIISLLISLTVNASNEDIERVLDEAEDYLIVKPSHSLTLLNNISDLSSHSDTMIIRWHILTLRASVSMNQLSNMDDSIAKLITYEQSSYFKSNLVTIFSAIGIWLRRSGYPHYANTSLHCALTFAKNPKHRLALLNSKALVARDLKQYQHAQSLYNQATLIASKHNNQIKLATIDNNLGAIALDNQQYDLAEKYFKHALTGHQNEDNRSGHITAGLNLLFLYALQDQTFNYQRLYDPISSLTYAFPSKAKRALLFWIHTTYSANGGPVTDNRLKKRLVSEFELLESRRVKQLVKVYLADKLNVEVRIAKKPQPRKINLNIITSMPFCNWKSAKPQ